VVFSGYGGPTPLLLENRLARNPDDRLSELLIAMADLQAKMDEITSKPMDERSAKLAEYVATRLQQLTELAREPHPLKHI
jgi:hypothetical protein